MRIGLLALTLAAAGCYKYTPIQQQDVQPQTMVRARLSVSQAEQVRELVAVRERMLEGVIVTVHPDALTIEVPSATRAAGATMQVLHQRIGVPRSGIVELEIKQLDRRRTGLLIGAGVLLAAAAAYEGLSGNPGKEGTGRGEPGPEFRVPLIRLR